MDIVKNMLFSPENRVLTYFRYTSRYAIRIPNPLQKCIDYAHFKLPIDCTNLILAWLTNKMSLVKNTLKLSVNLNTQFECLH